MGSGQLTVGRVFLEAARAQPDRMAAALESDQLTFRQVQDRADRCRAGLRARGVRFGDRLGVWADIDLRLVPLFAATSQEGVAFLPIDPSTPAADLPELTRRTGVSRLVVDSTHTPPPGLDVPIDRLDELATETSSKPTRVEVDETAAQAVFLTSGSTGEPKGVVLSHRTQWLRSTAGPLPDPRGVTVCMFPLFHMAGWLIALQAWQARCPVVFVRRADAESLLTAIEGHRAQRLYAIPAVWHRILAADPDGARGGTLRLVDTGTSATPPELLTALGLRYPQAARRVFYGSTEAGPVLMLDHDEVDGFPGAVGRPHAGVEVRRADDGGLLVRGIHCFDTYLDGTAGNDPDGWYATGDLAEIDQGVWSITGRSRQIIRTGGESVVPAEVERVLREVPGVAEAVVVGLPDQRWGETVVAVLVPEEDAGNLRDDAEAACASSLVPAKRPRRYEIAASLPRTTATGQVRRPLIVERLLAGRAVDGEGLADG